MVCEALVTETIIQNESETEEKGGYSLITARTSSTKRCMVNG